MAEPGISVAGLRGPPPVAVHDHRDMRGHRLARDLGAETAEVDGVGGAEGDGRETEPQVREVVAGGPGGVPRVPGCASHRGVGDGTRPAVRHAPLPAWTRTSPVHDSGRPDGALRDGAGGRRIDDPPATRPGQPAERGVRRHGHRLARRAEERFVGDRVAVGPRERRGPDEAGEPLDLARARVHRTGRRPVNTSPANSRGVPTASAPTRSAKRRRTGS